MWRTFASFVGVGVVCASVSAAHATYSDAVDDLSPTHYYRLDETAKGTVTDTGSGTLIHGFHEGSFPPMVAGDLGVDQPGFAAGNKSLYTADEGGVNLGAGSSFASSTMTVASWFKMGGSVNEGDRIFTNNQSSSATHLFQVNVAVGGWGLVVATGQTLNDQLALQESSVSVKDGQWHHVVAVRNGPNVNDILVVLDGVDVTSQMIATGDTWNITGSNAHIGTRVDGDNVTSNYHFNGWIDDTAIWLNRALTLQEAQGLYNAAVSDVPEPASLMLLAAGGALLVRRRRG